MMNSNRDSEKSNYDSYYDGRYIYVPKSELFAPGDIILTRNRMAHKFRDKFKSAIIAGASFGEFSHASICAHPPMFVEAIDGGVSACSMLNRFCHNLENICVLRHPDPTISQNAANWALPKLGIGYSVKKAICSVYPFKLEFPTDKGTFCSALVAAAYAAAGDKFFTNKDPLKFKPSDFVKASSFRDITHDMFTEILSPKNVEEMSALDGDSRPSPASKQTELFLRLYDEACNIFQAANVASDDNFPSSFIDMLKFLEEVISNDTTSDQVITLLSKAEEVDSFISESPYFIEFLGLMAKIKKRDYEENKRLLEESFKHDPDIDAAHIRRIYYASIQQRTARARFFENFDIRSIKSKSFRMFIDNQLESINSFSERGILMNEIHYRIMGKNIE